MSLQLVTDQPELTAIPLPIPENPTFDQIVGFLDDHDSGVIRLSDEDLARLTEMLVAKVDNCKWMLDHWESEAERWGKYARENYETKRAIEAKAERMKKRIADSMARRNFDKLPGERYRLQIQYVESLEITCDPDEFTAKLNPELIRARYEWNKEAVKDAMRNGMADFPYAVLRERPSVRFYQNRKDK